MEVVGVSDVVAWVDGGRLSPDPLPSQIEVCSEKLVVKFSSDRGVTGFAPV